ncbi:MAG: hypothetical protein EPO40_19730 [Myxococcaceae bacterium]|nr:MAG: hypothetical protein EPO40_19730 [Myxococcaceae bacterium]
MSAPRCSCDRAGLPEGRDQCSLCDLDEVNEVATVPPPAPSDDDIAGVLANDEAAAGRLLTIHNGTRGPVATFPRADVRRLLDAHQHAVESAQLGGRLLEAPTVYPPASERCACGRLEVPGVAACRGCLDPVEQAFAAWLAAEAADEGLTPEQRVQLRRRRTAHVNARTTARLAAGPP